MDQYKLRISQRPRNMCGCESLKPRLELARSEPDQLKYDQTNVSIKIQLLAGRMPKDIGT